MSNQYSVTPKIQNEFTTPEGHTAVYETTKLLLRYNKLRAMYVLTMKEMNESETNRYKSWFQEFSDPEEITFAFDVAILQLHHDLRSRGGFFLMNDNFKKLLSNYTYLAKSYGRMEEIPVNYVYFVTSE